MVPTDSPRVADADRATGRVVGLSFQLAVLLPRRRIFIYFTFATPRFSHIVFVLISNCFTEVPSDSNSRDNLWMLMRHPGFELMQWSENDNTEYMRLK